MIAFFRRLRRRIIGEGKTWAYLKYALGEIVLVVLGILIALQINNWNNQRLEAQRAITLYENLKAQVEDDLRNIEGMIEYNAFLNERAHVVVEKLSTDNRVQQDTTARYAAELMNYSDFDNRGNIHETLVNSGEILLIRNQGIRDRLRRIEEKYQYINRMENIHFDIIKLRYVPLISEAVDFVDIGVENIERLFDIRIQNLVAILIKVMDEKDMVYKDTVGHIQALISALEDELREN